MVTNVITALTSNGMIAPSYWVDPRSGNDYMLTVQYPENQIKTCSICATCRCTRRPAHGSDAARRGEPDHAASSRRPRSITTRSSASIDIYVNPATEDLGGVATGVAADRRRRSCPANVRIALRGMVQGMHASFRSFGLGLILAVVLLYLILVAQFRSFIDPLLILLAVPTGLTGVLVALFSPARR